MINKKRKKKRGGEWYEAKAKKNMHVITSRRRNQKPETNIT